MTILKIFKTLWREKNEIDVKKTEEFHLDDFKYKTIVDIRRQDFDISGVVCPNIYLSYLEIARQKYWERVIKWNFQKAAIRVGQVKLDYVLPIYPNEPVNIYLKTSRIGQSSLDIDYILVKVLDKKEYICCKAQTICTVIDQSNHALMAIPPIEKNKIKEFELL